MSQEQYIKSVIRSGECAACGGALAKSPKVTNLFYCKAHRAFAWGCRDCDHYFHANEYFPTSTPIRCPSCGSDYLMDAHFG